MSDKKTKETKTPENPEESLTKQLKVARAERAGVKGTFEAERKTMKAARKDSIQEGLGARGRAINELKKVADAKKAEHKATKDQAIKDAEEEYRIAEEELSIARAEAVDSAKFVCEESYGAINHQLDIDSAPIIEKHKADLKETEDSFEFEMADIKAKEQEAVKETETTIAKIEEALKNLKKKPKKKGKEAA